MNTIMDMSNKHNRLLNILFSMTFLWRIRFGYHLQLAKSHWGKLTFSLICLFSSHHKIIFQNLADNSAIIPIFATNVRPAVAEAIIQPSEEVSESAVPSAVA